MRIKAARIASFSGGLLELTSAIGQSDVEFFSSLDNVLSIRDCKTLCLPLLCRDVVGDLSSVGSVVHEKELDVFFITNEELLESVGQEEAGLSG